MNIIHIFYSRLFFFFIFACLTQTSFSQSDSTDVLTLRSDKILNGKVIIIDSTSVEFQETITDSLYEYSKNEIKEIKLFTGEIIRFDEEEEGGTTAIGYIVVALAVALLIWTLTLL